MTGPSRPTSPFRGAKRFLLEQAEITSLFGRRKGKPRSPSPARDASEFPPVQEVIPGKFQKPHSTRNIQV
jgi:hypothetical protein